MGMDLYRVKDRAYFRWSIHYWSAVLELAQRYGWEPICTADPRATGCEHVGSYLRNNGRVVTSEDANAMAVALEKALPDIPSQEAIIDKTVNPEACRSKGLSPMIDLNNLDKLTPAMAREALMQLCDGAVAAGGGNSTGLVVGGYFAPEVWATLNCFEKLAMVKPKLKDFIAYLRGGAFEIH